MLQKRDSVAPSLKPDYNAYRARILFRTTGFEIADIRSKQRSPFWIGRVNGPPIKDEAGNIVYVPLWCEREAREATTVYVHIENIVRPLEDDEAWAQAPVTANLE